MKSRSFLSASFRAFGLLAFALVGLSPCGAQVINIKDQLELFADDYVIEELKGGAQKHLCQPEPKEVVLTTDAPWEGNSSEFFTVFQDGEIYRMYFRAGAFDFTANKPLREDVTCMMESKDGITWVRPNVGIFDFEGTKENNIVWMGDSAIHNFTPFKDGNPAAPPEARYKAIAEKRAPRGYESADGVHWRRAGDKPLVTDGTFDSQNLAFWDSYRNEYRMYWRTNPFYPGGFQSRSIATATSPDFVNWGAPQPLRYPGKEEPKELWDMQLYTSGVQPYFRAPHLFVGFPTRVLKRYRSEVLFMISRDGVNFFRWDEPAIPSTAPQDRGGNRGNFMAWGMLQLPGKPDEISVYATEGGREVGPYRRLRRFAYRLDGFVRVGAGAEGGEVVTKALLFSGTELTLNYKAHEGGEVRVEFQNETGGVIKGFSAQDCDPLTGDSTRAIVKWKGKSDLSGAPSQEAVRVRFVLKNADLYSLKF